MFCKKCGAAMDADAVFCKRCGTKQDEIFPQGENSFFESRDNILYRIEQSRPILSELKELEEEILRREDAIKKIMNNPRNASKETAISLLCLLVSCSLGIMAILLVTLLLFSVLEHSILGYIIIIIFGVGSVKFASFISKKIINKYRQKLSEKIEPLEEEINPLYEKYRQKVMDPSLEWLPAKYAYGKAIDCIIGYIRDQRASTVQDAINLYETEMHRARLENKITEVANAATLSSLKLDSILLEMSLNRTRNNIRQR